MARVLIDGVEYVPLVPGVNAPDDNSIPLGTVLKRRRKACHMTLDAASKRVPCSKSYLWEIEQGHGEPSFRIVAALCRIYGLPMNWLTTTQPEAR